MSDDSQAIRFLIEFILISIIVLFYYDDMRSCAAPMYWWIIGEWVGFVLLVLVGILNDMRYRLGHVLGMVFIVVYYVFNMCGFIIYLVCIVKTPNCIPSFIRFDLGAFLCIIFVILLVILVKICSEGLGSFNKKFFSETESTEAIDCIRSGKHTADYYINGNNNIDSYSLFDSEIKVMEDICRVNRSKMNGGTITGAYPTTEELYREKTVEDERKKKLMEEGRDTESPTCSICMDACDLHEPRPIITHPGCSHMYHSECISSWVKRTARCPVCRQGTRSGLYRCVQSNI